MNFYEVLMHRALAETAALKVAHEDMRELGIDYSDTERTPSYPTLPVPTAPTIPTLRSR